MTQLFSAEESKLKLIFKSALIEVLDERRDLLVEAIEEAIEDVALLHAIKEGESSDIVSENDVFQLLEAQ
uniref:Uncharacterized protein n=1 Tax=Candidatus Kentrum sp. DK TaxID=2126562 RepID=A0A450S0K8_9GAMM|nr:MAG: hypothetical protein BECKDK2373C_GA0170839_101049 [Candidatus Kentron sp. DK]